MAAQGSESINLETLDTQQLSQVKKQLEEELEHLTNSFAQLHSAQSRFKECLRCVKAKPGAGDGMQAPNFPVLSVASRVNISLGDKSVLVPLTNSLYDTESAERFYEAKVQNLMNNIQDLEVIVQRKTLNVRSVEDVLRQKVLQSQIA
ncbi:prefoldin [Colletotrichum paranaense]|uniref:Prefoldin n=1 Tax=Colletotrichum paranaense TaxID=1914294 RepID=A0ABQ9S1G6_9PEZI|nr:prefoldin [Colletotrichum paranaense]KAK1521882.1 prefoldin [Colletotrichum paranaense]